MRDQLSKETEFSIADALAYLRTDQSDLHDRLCADIIEALARERDQYKAIAELNAETITAMQACYRRLL